MLAIIEPLSTRKLKIRESADDTQIVSLGVHPCTPNSPSILLRKNSPVVVTLSGGIRPFGSLMQGNYHTVFFLVHTSLRKN
jgi:hypothetical protein